MVLIDLFSPGRLYRAGIGALGCLLVLVPLLWLTPGAVAAPPNDNFANAAELSGLPVEWTGSNVDATREPDDPIPGERSIWFRWTAPTDGGITVAFGGCAPPFQESFQGSLTAAVYTKSVFGLVQIEQPFHATAGQVYWIAVASGPITQPADPDICVRLVPGPANDDFARATPLTGFPVSAAHTSQINAGAATREPGEPDHGGPPDPPRGSVWYSWTAPADRPLWVRGCGDFGQLAVYTGNRVDALTHVATRRARGWRCGSLRGASVLLSAVEGEVYRIAVTSLGSFQLLVGNQVAVAGKNNPFLVYTAFPGQSDHVKLRLTGSGPQRALLLEAGGLTAANGCQADLAPGVLRCPVPGKATVALDIDLGDGDDTADIRLPGRVTRSDQDVGPSRVLGGAGNDTLAGSAGYYRSYDGWTGGLLGGPGADTLGGGTGDDRILGGPGPDRIDPGAGSDRIESGPGNDRVRTLDGATDSIRCQAGRDSARIDGIDLAARGCERRNLSSPARAVATGADLSNDGGDSWDHLEIWIACPIDAKRGCPTTVTVSPRGRAITRRLRLPAGGSGLVRAYGLADAAHDRLLRHGVGVTVSTLRHGRANLNFTRHLPVTDDRYLGEG